MLVSAICNALLNHLISKGLKSDNYRNFAIRSFISTAVAQFIDNLIFATVVSHIFFGWSWIQVLTCSLTGALMELLGEVVLSPIGYKATKKWKEEKVGQQYLDFISKEKQQAS